MLLLGVVQEQAISVAPVGEVGSYDLLATEILTSSQASVTFSGLSSYASTYKHLQIRVSVSHTGTGGNALAMRINGDTGSNYSYHEIVADGTSAVASNGIASQTSILAVTPVRQNLSNTSFAGGVVDILDPWNTSKNTTVRGFGGHASTLSIIGVHSGMRMNTEAISSVTLFMSSNNIGANSRLSIYGIKAA